MQYLQSFILILKANLILFNFQLAEEAFKEALGDGVWRKLIDTDTKGNRQQPDPIKEALYKPLDASASVEKYRDTQLFSQIEEAGVSVELPWIKIPPLFNLGTLLEHLHRTEMASILYRLILFKVCC